MRDRIDHSACLIRQHIDNLMHQVRALARSPAALPIAFVCGILAERLHVPSTKYVYELLAGHAKAMQIASSFLGSPVR